MLRQPLVYAVLVLALWAFPEVVHSQNITVQFEIEGSGPCRADATGTGSVPIAGNCGNYVIANKGGGARVETGTTDANNDFLALRDAIITRTGNVNGDLHITYFATPFAALPSDAPPGPGVWYRIQGAGTFKRNNSAGQLATGSRIKANGHIQSPSDSADVQIGSPPPSFTVSNNNAFSPLAPAYFIAQGVWNPLVSPRELKGQIWVKLNDTTHSLEINTIPVENTSGGRGKVKVQGKIPAEGIKKDSSKNIK